MKTSLIRLVVSLAAAFSAAAQLPASIVNLSTRGALGSDTRQIVTGFVIAGDAPKNVLVRGVGPGLTAFGVADAAASVKVELYDSAGALVAANDGYRTAAAPATLDDTAAQVGAFPLSSSGDSALVAALAPGAYTAVVSAGGDGSARGSALAEVYDADAPGSTSILVNASGRGAVGSGGGVLITGFVLAGDTSHQILIRGIGRDLAKWGVANPAAAVDVAVFSSKGEIVALSDRFAAHAEQNASTSQAMGAFAMNDTGGSVAIVTLAPGAYTIMVIPSPANTDASVGMLEVYDGGPSGTAVVLPATL
jgi:hypothetical protein